MHAARDDRAAQGSGSKGSLVDSGPRCEQAVGDRVAAANPRRTRMLLHRFRHVLLVIAIAAIAATAGGSKPRLTLARNSSTDSTPCSPSTTRGR